MAAAGIISKPELFDHRRFGISRVEASAMDPQQRLVLEQGYAALQRSVVLLRRRAPCTTTTAAP